MRTFIAIEFDNETKKNITQLQNKIKNDCKKGNFTAKDNLHLTMHFLGEIEQDDLDGIADAMSLTASLNRKFELNFEKTGYFDRGEKCIIWLGIQKSKELVRLYEILEKNLVKQGFRREKTAFTPHVTLAREAMLFYNKSLILSKFKPEFDGMIVKEISLMESKRVNGRLIYKKLYGAKLL